jgi:hypothetical protein
VAGAEPLAQRAIRDSELAGRVGLNVAQDVNQDERLTEPIGQSVQFLVKHAPSILSADFIRRESRFSQGGGTFNSFGASPSGTSFECNVVRDFVEPRAHRFGPANRGSLLGQRQKRRLKNVVYFVIAHQSSTYAEHSWPVPAHQGGESGFVP